MGESSLLKMLKESRYTTVLSGYEMLYENGYPSLRDGDEAYEYEQKYGYSPEEMLSSSFYSTRTEKFFEFYREVILNAMDTPPGKGYYGMAKLERRGLFQVIITRRLFGLPERAGCRNVINLHGSIYHNYCPHCGRQYPVEYIKNTKRVPLCESCNTVIRPGITLFGEMVNNQVITRAAEEVKRAEVLLLLGTHVHTSLSKRLINYYEGDKLVVVNPESHFSERYADIVIHQRVDDTLEQIQRELGE